MPANKKRRAIANLYVEWHMLITRGLQTIERPVDYESIVIEWTILLAHLEDRKITAAQLARSAMIPRTTVLRKLEVLIARGVVVKSPSGYAMTGERIRDRRYIEALNGMARLITRASRELERL